MRYVQLAEAMKAVREELALVRVLRRTDPTALVSGLAAQFLVGLGKDDEVTTSDKLLLKAYAVLRARPQPWVFGDLHAAARMYRLAGQHQRAQTYAARAADEAYRQHRALGADRRG